MLAERFPIPIRPIECALGLFADKTDGVILRRRRLLADQRAFAVPHDVIRARPSVSRPHVLPILKRHVRVNVVIQPAHRPAMMRLAGGVIELRLAIEKHVRPAEARLHDIRMPPVTRIAALHKKELSLRAERISTPAGDHRDRIDRRAVLDGDPLGLLAGHLHAVIEMPRGQLPRPRVFHVVE